jgi:predicted phosphodiesterase
LCSEFVPVLEPLRSECATDLIAFDRDPPPVPTDVIRILSDLHYGDRGSRIDSLPSLTPLFDGASALVLNGDTIDTRPGPLPAATVALRAEALEFFAHSAPPATILTGNHDPDISTRHTLDLAAGLIFVTHGDILFEDLVPWGQDAPAVRQRIADRLADLTPEARDQLDSRLAVYRGVAASIPQRHQSERDGFKYTLGFLADTVWPPTRVLHVLRAWRRAPGLAAALTRRYRPAARFAIIGHIHRPGAWLLPNGVVVLNTGSFTPPFSGCVIDVHPDRLMLRRVVRRRGEFRLGHTVTEFALAPA